MICKKDRMCNELASNFTKAKNQINPEFDKVASSLDEVSTGLKNLQDKVPMTSATYLGNKVKEELEKLATNMDSYKADVLGKKTAMNAYADSEIKLHKAHYESWVQQYHQATNNYNNNNNTANTSQNDGLKGGLPNARMAAAKDLLNSVNKLMR